MRKLRIVVGIPTLNRPDDLRKTLVSILENTIHPDKVVIVDQSTDDRTEQVLEDLYDNLNIEYLKVPYKGLTKARNEILKCAADFDIVTFLDDDVVLDRKYLENVLKAFQKDKNLTGCQGFIENQSIIKGLVSRVVSGTPILTKPKVTDSFVNLYPLFPPSHPVESEWLSGCNMSYRVKHIEVERFNENFILYGLGEDLEFSHRLFLKGKHLLMIPSIRLKHIPSGLKRLPSKVGLLMRFAYRRYMIAKYRNRDRIDELFQNYVESYKKTFRILWFKNPMLYRKMMMSIDETLNELKRYFDLIDVGNLHEVNQLIKRGIGG